MIQTASIKNHKEEHVHKWQEHEISDCIKYLGVWADQHLTFKYHIKIKCKMAMWNLQELKIIRLILTTEVANTLAMGTIISHLDYSNSIYSGLPETDLQKFQRVQNTMAKTYLERDSLQTQLTVPELCTGSQ